MKSIYKLFVTLIFTLVFLSSSLVSQEKLYVVFSDIDNVYNTNFEQIISNGFDELYWKPLLTNNYFTENLYRTGYSAFFNSNKKLTDYEVAIFYMGMQPLQWDGGTGKKAVREIKTMLDAGKRVILIGTQLLSAAFHPNSQFRDAEVQQFFEDYLGIDQNAYLLMITANGGTPIKFGINSPQSNPVSKGYHKICNYAHGPGTCSQDELPPWRYTATLDCINKKYMKNTKKGNMAESMEWFTWVSDWFETALQYNSDTLVGVNVQNKSNDPMQDSKIVFWSSGFEIASACHSISNWKGELWQALQWCTFDLPKPGPNLEFNTNPLDFKTVAVEDSTIKTGSIRNIGRETLVVTDIYLEGFADDGIFRILDNETEFEIEPGESRDIEIGFYPQGEQFYRERFAVASNSSSGSLLHLILEGYGGKKPEAGPKLAVTSNKLDFGTIKPSEQDTMYIELLNTGTGPLFIMRKFHWPRETQPPFMYDKSYQWSFTVEPGGSYKVGIKFAPSGKEGTFYDTIGVIPENAVNYKNDTLWLTLKGISSAGGDTDEKFTLSSTEINIDSTDTDTKKLAEFEIENSGSKKIFIKTLNFKDDFGGVFKLYDKNEEEFQHKLPGMELALVGPSKKRLFYVEFAPKEVKTYNGTIAIEMMNDQNVVIDALTTELPVTAIGKQGISVENISYGEYLTIEIAPNPVYDVAKLYYKIKQDSNIELFVVDNLGNKVLSVLSGRMESGNYLSEINTENLASGMYYIVAYNNGEVLKVPMVLIK